ncbi:MAG: hypothetical protein C4339_05995 [Nitrososphaerota archaeon]
MAQEPTAFQLVLAAVELVLLGATVLLLMLNRREIRSRELMMRRFTSVADAISRQEYFVAVIEALQKAEEQVFGSVTGSMPGPEEAEVVQKVLEAVSEACRRGVRVRYLLPLAPDRLRMARRYREAGAEVKFSPSVLVSDMRYMCVDDRLVIVGVPGRKGRDEPTRKGYTIPSESLAILLRERFEEAWQAQESKTYAHYLRELVAAARASQPGLSAELIAKNLGVGEEDVAPLLGGAA